ncbi:DUF3322 domain-containing protein [Legionella sp.]|uniref:DUF3322 domain-containing protein n=1 Tax=Legionella sp. TaxID=459 RepID=UPI0039E41625
MSPLWVLYTIVREVNPCFVIWQLKNIKKNARHILPSNNSWTTLPEIRNKVTGYWDSGRLLAETLAPTDLFPWRIPLRVPSSVELSVKFEQVRVWIRELQVLPKLRAWNLNGEKSIELVLTCSDTTT